MFLGSTNEFESTVAFNVTEESGSKRIAAFAHNNTRSTDANRKERTSAMPKVNSSG